MTPEPSPQDRLLHLVDRLERGVALPAEITKLRTGIRDLYALAHPSKEKAA
ncbi:hypothetical protein [Streptomyces sp. NPDC056817]|uniref:hypothetical protein n=1 Tax=Streptomyces sp. NPDC056817 TaxID=3345950 RepID=UPI00369EED54